MICSILLEVNFSFFLEYIIDEYTIRMILFDGRYHQIRRAIVLAGNTVINLKRIRVGKYLLDDMKINELREIKKG